MVKDKESKNSKKSAAVEKPQDEAHEQSKIWQDERFQHLVADPRFKRLPMAQRKVKIDKRFQSMFTDKKFKVKYTVDKYGRRVNTSNSEDLRKYYELDEQTDTDSDNEAKESEERRKEELAISCDAEQEEVASVSNEELDENDELDSDGEVVSKSLQERLFDPEVDYARGDGRLITDSSSDDESSEEEDVMLEMDHVWGELDASAETTDESTKRLALLNMDWDRIRAVDIMMLLSSFVPPGGSITSVSIYPSEFGKERLAEEEVHGPQELVGLGKGSNNKKQGKEQAKEDMSDDDDEDLVQAQDSDAEEGDEYHMEKLRQYQLNRLRYYYAVVECDTVATADKIYKECDGLEYESSATRIDLRFIPADTSFDEDEPRDVCNDMPDAHTYKPRQFTTTALQQAKVDLTWDETAVERRELGDKLATGKLDDVSDRELRQIIAYSSEEEECEQEDEKKDAESGDEVKIDNDKILDKCGTASDKEETQNPLKQKQQKKSRKNDGIDKYKALLAEITAQETKEKNQKYEMEFTWDLAADSAAHNDKDLDRGQQPNSKAQLTPIEKVLQKRSEKNKRRKEEQRRKKLQAQGRDPDETADNSDADSMPDGIDMNDPYFAEEFANGDFEKATAPSKSSKKQKKRAKMNADDEEANEKQAKELELLLDDENDGDSFKQHFSLEQIIKNEQQTKSKRKRQKQLKKSKTNKESQRVEDNFQINLNDTRFNAIYTEPQFNIDPTDSRYKKTKAMEQIVQEKLKRRHGDGQQKQAGGDVSNGVDGAKRPRKNVENTMLVKSLKRKLQQR